MSQAHQPDRLTLDNGALRLVLEPEGALISSCDWSAEDGRIPLLYAPGERPRAANGIPLFGLWPMLPFANRCTNGRLLDSSDRPLPINDPEHGRTMHGCGWQRRWAVARADDLQARIVLEEAAFGPYRFSAEVSVALAGMTLEIGLSVVNLADVVLPHGCGLHPWFPYSDGMTLQIGAPRHAVLSADYRVLEAEPVDLTTDFRKPRRLPADRETTVQFLDWDGRAMLRYPGRYALALETLGNLSAPLLWRPADAPFLCFEPQSHCIGAAGESPADRVGPLTRLSPREAISCGLRITLRADAVA